MREWTDVDYAQAAIDMLPGSVEEIAEFMETQGIGNRWKGGSCPIERWLDRWTNHLTVVGVTRYDVHEEVGCRIPDHVREYIYYVDRTRE